MDIYQRSLNLHRKTRGKVEIVSRMPLQSRDDLSLAYTPGVARPCEVIHEDPEQARDLTWKGRTVAVVSDGSAVLGLGDIGPLASLPVMEGKAVLFREFAGIDAVPLLVDVREPSQIIEIVRAVAPTFGGINLEDISAPRCFEIEAGLQEIGIPVLHDDQHGTAAVLLAAIRNALKVLGRGFRETTVVINGAGAAGLATARLLMDAGPERSEMQVKRLVLCDSKGIVYPGRTENNRFKDELARRINPEGRRGDLREALKGADLFIGVSKGNLLGGDDIRLMNPEPVVFALANPTPEILPDLAREAGAAIVGTGRSDFPNQVNNVLAFPGLFRGVLESRAKRFTRDMFFATAEAIAGCVPEPTAERVIPDVFDRGVAPAVARAVQQAAG